ncbi:hypothetical protein DFR50_15916 [Roseiarcus fermentans]|uniref:Uncharacterized protein n=1 Tax=Roseiarcus fermentans TaxID=1473586 RepID=A0A366EF72_9HYPH|nr:hypothetical protein [Roseiarcus fermentans]RBP01071.1 hypothetical protein DFR50_15916 [Roseiarcus fermentans]
MKLYAHPLLVGGEMTPRQEKLVKAAEKRMQAVLLELQEEARLNVETVEVDTRNFANLSVEITVK